MSLYLGDQQIALHSAGIFGKDGVGLSSVVKYFLATNLSSGITTSASGWQEFSEAVGIPAISSTTKYLWTYEVYNFSDDTTVTVGPYICGAYGDTGAKGDTGATGSTGNTGATGPKGDNAYVHIKYSSDGGTTFIDDASVATHIGFKTDNSATASTTPADYTWSALAALPDGLEYTSNRTNSITSTSTASQYPTAKAVYDYVNSGLSGITSGSSESTENATIYLTGVKEADGDAFYNQNINMNPSTGTINATIVNASKVYGAVWNDLAEWFERSDLDEVIEAGDICIWNGNGVTKSSCFNDARAIGVFSDSYGFILGGLKGLASNEDNIEQFVPIGLSGRVKVKVSGKVNIGR